MSIKNCLQYGLLIFLLIYGLSHIYFIYEGNLVYKYPFNVNPEPTYAKNIQVQAYLMPHSFMEKLFRDNPDEPGQPC